MRKDFGAHPFLFPQPVLIIGTYDENGKADAMNVAWGGICDMHKVNIFISYDHQTSYNLKAKKAFTVNIADVANVVACDYVGIASGKDTPDKMEKAGFHTTKSAFVDAPIIDELPLALECKVLEITDESDGYRVIGEIMNVSADERVLGDDGKIDSDKLQAISYESVHHNYLKVGGIVGKAFSDGNRLK